MRDVFKNEERIKHWREWELEDVVAAVRGASRVAGLTLSEDEIARLVRELLNGPFRGLADAGKEEK
jgi:hypothetical protein